MNINLCVSVDTSRISLIHLALDNVFIRSGGIGLRGTKNSEVQNRAIRPGHFPLCAMATKRTKSSQQVQRIRIRMEYLE
jgi:hypothetical protein